MNEPAACAVRLTVTPPVADFPIDAPMAAFENAATVNDCGVATVPADVVTVLFTSVLVTVTLPRSAGGVRGCRARRPRGAAPPQTAADPRTVAVPPCCSLVHVRPPPLTVAFCVLVPVGGPSAATKATSSVPPAGLKAVDTSPAPSAETSAVRPKVTAAFTVTETLALAVAPRPSLMA